MYEERSIDPCGDVRGAGSTPRRRLNVEYTKRDDAEHWNSHDQRNRIARLVRERHGSQHFCCQ